MSQKDIIETVNKHPDAGWTAAHNPYFANYTVSEIAFIIILSFPLLLTTKP